MKIIVEHNELLKDLINHRIEKIEDYENQMDLLKDVLRFGFGGYINMNKSELTNEVLSKHIYGPYVDDIEIK